MIKEEIHSHNNIQKVIDIIQTNQYKIYHEGFIKTYWDFMD